MKNTIIEISEMIEMVTITATISFQLDPKSPLMERTWQKITEAGKLNEQLQSLILIEPGFGLSLDCIEDAEIYPCGEVA
jgi:hypothetical protein